MNAPQPNPSNSPAEGPRLPAGGGGTAGDTGAADGVPSVMTVCVAVRRSPGNKLLRHSRRVTCMIRRVAFALLLMLWSCSGNPANDSGVNDAGAPDAGKADGGSDAGVTDGGQTTTDAGASFCSPCVMSSDCPSGAFCIGGVAPRCGLDCRTMACPGTLTCDSLSVGKGGSLGQNCWPSDSACGGPRGDAGLTCTDTFANYGSAFLSNNCFGSCHRHDSDWPTAVQVRQSADAIRLSVETGLMPQGATISIAEQRRLMTWLSCGAP